MDFVVARAVPVYKADTRSESGRRTIFELLAPIVCPLPSGLKLMRTIKIAALLLSGIFFITSAYASAGGIQTAEEGARRLANAMQEGNAPVVVSMLSPVAVELMRIEGGLKDAAALVQWLDAQYATNKKLGMHSSVKLGPASAQGIAGKQFFQFFPYLMTFSVAGRLPREGRGVFVGVSNDEGKTWSYFEGAGLKSRLGETLLPKYNGIPPMPEPLPLSDYK